MKTITVYDNDADVIDHLAQKNDMTTAEIVEILLEYKDEMCAENDLKDGQWLI